MRNAAEERLLDAAMAEVFGREPVRAHRALHRYLAAALLLLGVGVVALTLWLPRDDRAPATMQQPAQEPPLPDEVSAEDEAGFAALPADTVNLVAWLSGPEQMRWLLRFRGLRRLVVLGMPSGAASQWAGASAQDTALAPLRALTALEEVQLPFDLVVRPEHIAALRELGSLRTLAFGNVVASPELADAVVALPALQELRLTMVAAGAPFFARLARAGRPLRGLELNACPGLDADAWHAIAALSGLRRLVVTCQHEGTTRVAGATHKLGTLGDEAFAAFAALPDLRELGLDESSFDDRMLLRLPKGLQLLDLGDRPMGALAADALRPLAALRDLTFGCGLDAAVAAEVLGALHLQRLDYRGWLQPEVLRAVAAQPGLVEFAARLRAPIDLAPLATAPRLA
ncbi:MAG TPA: hypothetical protein VFZ65_00885, partial [Planctomycetota bacterium]|nr:hypothetical protein [Planctomycetota bacterium]